MLQSENKSPSILAFCGPEEVLGSQIRFDLANTHAALVRYHGEHKAFFLFSEAFAEIFAQLAQHGGSPVAARFSLEVALDNAQLRAKLPSFDIGGAGAA